MNRIETWPTLDYSKYQETLKYVHLCTQVVGKIRLRKMPWLNHSWHVSLYITPRGFTTGSIPTSGGLFDINFDFIDHQLILNLSDGNSIRLPLRSQTLAEFYHKLFKSLNDLGVSVSIHAAPNEMEPAIPFSEDHRNQIYVPEEMENLWQAMICIHKVFLKFRAGFIGKCSPVHLFWGAFDLAVTRFSGRKAPEHPGGMPNMPLKVMQEAYSHEVSSCGFWPGNDDSPQPVFYAYCYPTPEAFGHQAVTPEQAFFSKEMGEFFLPYQVVLDSQDPESSLMSFLNSTYQAAAETGDWDTALEYNFAAYEKR